MAYCRDNFLFAVQLGAVRAILGVSTTLFCHGRIRLKLRTGSNSQILVMSGRWSSVQLAFDMCIFDSMIKGGHNTADLGSGFELCGWLEFQFSSLDLTSTF